MVSHVPEDRPSAVSLSCLGSKVPQDAVVNLVGCFAESQLGQAPPSASS